MNVNSARSCWMLRNVRDDDELARLDYELLVSELHAQPAFHHEEQLVFMLVVVPDELTLELRELHVIVIHFAHDLGTPLILKPAEHLGEIDFADVHEARSRTVFVSTTVENSPFRSARATSCTSSDS